MEGAYALRQQLSAGNEVHAPVNGGALDLNLTVRHIDETAEEPPPTT
jgi:hypothetical protein